MFHLGSASIGQVHAATLTDDFLKLSGGYSGGKEVAVKVMHVDAEERFRNDFKILKVRTGGQGHGHGHIDFITSSISIIFLFWKQNDWQNPLNFMQLSYTFSGCVGLLYQVGLQFYLSSRDPLWKNLITEMKHPVYIQFDKICSLHPTEIVYVFLSH